MTEDEFKSIFIYKRDNNVINYFKSYESALNYLNKINYLINGLEDYQIIYYANLNKDRELGFAHCICEIAKPKK
jgi:hypothetical protein